MLPHIACLHIVDHEHSRIDAFKALLEPRMYVIHASSAPTALALFRAAIFDLILLDMRLSELDGGEALERLRNNADTFDVRVLLLSAGSDEPAVLRTLNAGADDVLQHLLENDLTRARIQQYLFLKRRQNALRQTVTELQASSGVTTQCLRTAAHDLN